MTVLFLNPSNEQLAIGGVRKIYDYAALLTAAGTPAAVVQGVRGFRPSWFAVPDDVEVREAPLTVRSDDLLVVPEYLGPRLTSIVPGAARVSLNLNAYTTFEGCDWRHHPYSTTPVLGVGVMSEDSAAYVRCGWPDLPVQVLTPGLDPREWSVSPSPRPRRIAYMPRKRSRLLEQVLGLLTAAGDLDGWELRPLDGLHQTAIADELRQAPLFLSFSQLEGFGLPPLEALASGCHVIGFHGNGGREFFVHPFATDVPEDDVVAFAGAVRSWLRDYDEDAAAEQGRAGSAWAFEHYRLDEEQRLLSSWLTPLHDALDRSARPLGTLTAAETMGPHGRPRSKPYRIARTLRHLLEA